MMKYRCDICGYVYDEDLEERPVNDLDCCPQCHMDQTHLKPIDEQSDDIMIVLYAFFDIIHVVIL